MKKLENQVRNEIFRQMSLTSTLALDVPVRPMDAKGLTLSHQHDIPIVNSQPSTRANRTFRTSSPQWQFGKDRSVGVLCYYAGPDLKGLKFIKLGKYNSKYCSVKAPVHATIISFDFDILRSQSKQKSTTFGGAMTQ